MLRALGVSAFEEDQLQEASASHSGVAPRIGLSLVTETVTSFVGPQAVSTSRRAVVSVGLRNHGETEGTRHQVPSQIVHDSSLGTSERHHPFYSLHSALPPHLRRCWKRWGERG
jgi:hypothetical protein